MLGKLLGAFIGSRIDRRDGEGGVKGAMLGAATAGVLRRLGPIGLAIGGVVVAKRLLSKRRTRGDTTV
jgi:hypothetical protein